MTDSQHLPSKRHARARQAGRGFTLVEIMVVLVIIGIVLSVAMVSLRFSDHQAVIEQEALRLQALVHAVRQESVLNDVEIGVIFEPDRYNFVIYRAGKWVSMTDNNLWRERVMPPDVYMELLLDDQSVSIQLPVTDGDKDRQSPQVFFLSSGEMTAFEVLVRSHAFADGHYRVTGELNGRIEVEYAG